jgi:hypothetical protein
VSTLEKIFNDFRARLSTLEIYDPLTLDLAP